MIIFFVDQYYFQKFDKKKDLYDLGSQGIL